MHKRMMFHPIIDLWNAMSSMMKQALEGEARLDNTPRNFDPSTLASLEAMAPMTQIRLQDPVSCKQK
jgi:hypothetical protein